MSATVAKATSKVMRMLLLEDAISLEGCVKMEGLFGCCLVHALYGMNLRRNEGSIYRVALCAD
uniref:Uncharacterized protein n=1 Tax=Arundo donax TaxID=35708 RepID=A0A0A9ADB7_ARUDO